MPHEIKPLKFKELRGFTARQISEHHDVLYAGYVKKLNEIQDKLKVITGSDANATMSEVRTLKLGETFAANGAKLHELYFDNLGGSGGEPSGKIAEMMNKTFGSFTNFKTIFTACGVSVRGWVVLAYDLDDKVLRIYSGDAHDVGAVWNAVPLLVLDVYEHAYFLDYGTKRKDYIDAFFNNISWDEVNQRLKTIK